MIKDREIKQELLNELLGECLRELKKQMFGRKHRKVLYNKVRIVPVKLRSSISGSYKTLKTRSKYKHIHKISINDSNLDYYLYWKKVCIETNDKYKSQYRMRRLQARSDIKDTIKHEIIHAYVKDRFIGDTTCNRDSSVMFLAILDFLGISSGHSASYEYLYSKERRYYKTCKDFEELEDQLLITYLEYRHKFEELKQIKVNDVICINMFYFGSGDSAGLKATFTTVGVYKDLIVKSNIFEVGCNVSPYRLKKLVNRKILNNNFSEKEYSTRLKSDQTLREYVSNKLRFQTLNI